MVDSSEGNFGVGWRCYKDLKRGSLAEVQQKGINSLTNLTFKTLTRTVINSFCYQSGSFENNRVQTISNIVAAPSFLSSIVLAMTEQQKK